MTRVVIMQPYFYPYLGYFRLFHCADIFVFYDTVQFPREGYVHRNRLLNKNGQPRWLPLALDYSPLKTPIQNMTLKSEWSDNLQHRAMHFPALQKTTDLNPTLTTAMFEDTPDFVTYLERNLIWIIDRLQIGASCIRASELKLPENLERQQKVIEICRLLNAKTYINAPGGRMLYHAEEFEKSGIKLKFLTPYQGSKLSILERAATHSWPSLKKDIEEQTVVID